jgi:hypothetical protein
VHCVSPPVNEEDIDDKEDNNDDNNDKEDDNDDDGDKEDDNEGDDDNDEYTDDDKEEEYYDDHDGLIAIDEQDNYNHDGLVDLNNDNDGLVDLDNDNDCLVGLECDGLVGFECNDTSTGSAVTWVFEGRSYRSHTDYIQARQSRTAGIFADFGMLAARSAIAEERTAPGSRRAKNPRDDLAIPPLLPQRKSSHIARTVSDDYDKVIDLAEFVRSDVSFGLLRGLNENRTLYPPNSRMSDFKRQILIFIHNFVPTDDVSITPKCFFTLGKLGKPNQSSWLMPFHVLGKCMHRYNPGQFIDVDAAVRSTVEQTILTNHMFFGGKKNWCDKRTGDPTSYNELAQLTDPLGQIFHEKLCAKIKADGGDYRVIFLGEHAWEGCRDWFYDDKILNIRSIAHGSLIRNNFHNDRHRDCFLRTLDAGAAFLSGKSPMPIDDAEKGTLLHIGRLSKSEEKIYDLTENAEDLLLEKERLESIAENAIAGDAPDANAAVLAADEASSAALLAMGKV